MFEMKMNLFYLPIQKNYVDLNRTLPLVYKSSIDIKKQKYEDFIRLKKVMPANSWPLFEQLVINIKKYDFLSLISLRKLFYLPIEC